jgi:hypothetical protein
MKTLILSLALLVPACGSPLDGPCEPLPTTGTRTTCIQELPDGLPSCYGIVWIVGGVVQDPATYEAICGAAHIITRDAATCAALKDGAESAVTAGCVP